MKVGLSTALNFCETEDALELIKQAGAECAEVYLRTFYEYRPEFAKKYAHLAGGLKINSVCTLPENFETLLLSAPRRTRGDGLYWLDQIMRSAQIFGAEYYVYRGLRKGEVDDFDYLGERLREINGFCSRFGIKLCLGNSDFGLYCRPDVFVGLKRQCPELYGALDLRQADPIGKYIDGMAGSISHVYADDGKSKNEYTELFKRLKDAGFDGAVIIDGPRSKDNIVQTLEFFKDIVYKFN